MEDLIFNYSTDSERTFEFPRTENIKALQVFGHSNAHGEGRGRQRVHVAVFTADEEEAPAVPFGYCDPHQQPEKLSESIKASFLNGFPVELVPESYYATKQ